MKRVIVECDEGYNLVDIKTNDIISDKEIKTSDLILVKKRGSHQLDTQVSGFLGWANGWKKDPEIYLKCKKLGHKNIEHNTGHCECIITCRECGYWYYVNSS